MNSGKRWRIIALIWLSGASAYPRIWDFQKLAEIARSTGAKVLTDMAHIAGLIAAICIPISTLYGYCHHHNPQDPADHGVV